MRLVVKVGTSTLTHPTGCLNIRRIEALCKVLSDLRNAGNEVILVSSGAVGMGVGKLNLGARPRDTVGKQAAAAVGQCELMYTYDKLFGEYNRTVAQILLTAEDFRQDTRHINFSNTMERLLSLGVIPVINENDTIATDEIEIGDNDTLAALVAESAGAGLLVLMSDIEGLFTADPHRDPDVRLIPEVRKIDDSVLSLGGGSGAQGTGGMATKLTAAKIATSAGCDMVICDGSRPENLYDIADGKRVGTRFFADKE